jgi:streptogramin lyase
VIISFRLRLAGFLLLVGGLLLAGAGVVALGPALRGPATAAAVPTLADTGILTEWPLPPNRGPWQIKWDPARNLAWFAEGNHANPGLDQVASLDPATNVLREWGVINSGDYVHGTTLDRSGNLWFTAAFLPHIGRLQPDTNTLTEWQLDPAVAGVHGIAVDDIISTSVTVWFTERDQNTIGSLNPATGEYRRHEHPIAFSKPHSVMVAPDHSVWFVDTCGNRVGQLIPGDPDVWNLWQAPTSLAFCGPPDGVGPLFGLFVGTDFWYSEPKNGNLVRLNPATGVFSVFHVPNGTNTLITQINPDDAGNIFFPGMSSNRLGRLEPALATPTIVAAVPPTSVSRPAPAQATAVPVSAVYTPIVTQLTPATQVLTGTRATGIVQWTLPPIPTPVGGGREIGPARAWWGGGGFWVSEVTANQVARFAPYTSTPAATSTPAPTNTPPPSSTPPPSTTPAPSATPTPGCALSFNDVPAGYTFYPYVQWMACRGYVSGYPCGGPGEPCPGSYFRPGNNVTRGQLMKMEVNAAGWASTTPTTPTFEDVAAGSTFYDYIETGVSHGVINGYPCGQIPTEPCVGPANRPYFRPNNNITRGQLSKVIALGSAYPLPTPTTGTFEDVPPGSTFFSYVEAVVAHGIVGGYPCGGPGEPCQPPGNRPYYRPNNNGTRGQVSKFVTLANGGP